MLSEEMRKGRRRHIDKTEFPHAKKVLEFNLFSQINYTFVIITNHLLIKTMSKYKNILEEELKNKIAHDYFSAYDSTQIIGKIDFCVAVPQDGTELFETESLLWAEAKSGIRKDIYKSFVQLILTIGKADFRQPPATRLPWCYGCRKNSILAL